ncbi:MAG TPA: CAP domain-containing protein, partial [Solirubrobacteraceae bacterium]|nr:CAP domain-containing protein [Solirubrobacteraceae bacterium]
SPTLSAAAAWKARHMAYYGYFGHDDPAPPVAQTVGERIAACGYAGSDIGENIAYGERSAAEVMQGWLASPGHRANIERADYRAIGVGVAAGAAGASYWVQDFGTVADAGAVVPPAGAPAAPAPGTVTPTPGTAPAPGQVSAAPSPSAAGVAARQAGRLLLAVHAAGRRLTLRLAVPATVRVRVTRRAPPACARGRCSRRFTRPVAAGQHRLRLPPVRPGAGVGRVVVVEARAAGLTDVRRVRLAPQAARPRAVAG